MCFIGEVGSVSISALCGQLVTSQFFGKPRRGCNTGGEISVSSCTGQMGPAVCNCTIDPHSTGRGVS